MQQHRVDETNLLHNSVKVLDRSNKKMIMLFLEHKLVGKVL